MLNKYEFHLPIQGSFNSGKEASIRLLSVSSFVFRTTRAMLPFGNVLQTFGTGQGGSHLAAAASYRNTGCNACVHD